MSNKLTKHEMIRRIRTTECATIGERVERSIKKASARLLYDDVRKVYEQWKEDKDNWRFYYHLLTGMIPK